MANTGKGKRLTGVFYDSPIQGLDYETHTTSGTTNENGEFQYLPGETVTFAIGDFVLGSTPGQKRVTPADLVIEVGKDIRKLKVYKVTNLARFIQSLCKDGNIENGVVITADMKKIIGRYKHKIDFVQNEEAFEKDPNVQAMLAELKVTLRNGVQARNHLRRSILGIKKLTDVKIPMRDGVYVLGDILQPMEAGKYPAIVSLGAIGKSFQGGRICNEKDAQDKEALEEEYFMGHPPEAEFVGGPWSWEGFEMPNSVDWVPRGYTLVRIDGRGVGKSPGTSAMFGLQEAQDLYDAIEWAAAQPWCNGSVGLWGTGYYAMDGYNAAQFQPPHLKAMIPIAGEQNSYRDYIWVGGGLFNNFSYIIDNNCKLPGQGVFDWVSAVKQNPFDEPELYGPKGSLNLSPDMSKIKVPVWVVMGESGTIHTRGSSEAYINTGSKDKKLTIVSEGGIHGFAFTKEFIDDHVAFFDHWLKGTNNDIMKSPPVRMMVRTGQGGYYWQYENEWPITRTQYTKYYLDASPSTYAGDAKKKDFMKLQKDAPKEEHSSAYSAEAEWSNKGTNWRYGVSFITEPTPEDVLLAGYFKLVTWVSSTSTDMQLHITVRVMDGPDEVQYPLSIFDSTTGRLFPISWGALKVSHRKLDPQKSTIYRPYHTHRKADYQPLKPGEPVEVEVEGWPSVSLIKKGYRIRLDIQPIGGDQLPCRIFDPAGEEYKQGAQNTIYTGPKHISYLQMPVIPPKK
jgi:predicted acyl esterase